MKLKRFTRQGNSLAIVIDRPILDMLNIDETTLLKITSDGRRIVLEPASKEEIKKRFGAAADKVEKKFAGMFKNLAEK